LNPSFLPVPSVLLPLSVAVQQQQLSGGRNEEEPKKGNRGDAGTPLNPSFLPVPSVLLPLSVAVAVAVEVAAQNQSRIRPNRP
jgi:hypothetical protein